MALFISELDYIILLLSRENSIASFASANTQFNETH